MGRIGIVECGKTRSVGASREHSPDLSLRRLDSARQHQRSITQVDQGDRIRSFDRQIGGQIWAVPPLLPHPRGELTEYLCSRLQRQPGVIPNLPVPVEDPLTGEDIHLALHLCFGLHYDGFQGVDDGWEWEPSLLALRAKLVEAFIGRLIGVAPEGSRPGSHFGPEGVVAKVQSVVRQPSGPSLSEFMVERGDYEQLQEFVIHRSIYQRKEADAHTWAIPRLRTRVKSAMVTLQADEYGNGRRGRSHAELFAITMEALDLDPTPGAYINDVPGVTLATDNLVSALGLSRRWRGALVGHLAAFEMTSVVSMSRYSAALRRLGVADRAAEFYDVHVVADRVHEQIAADELLVGLAESDPGAAFDVAFGVSALLTVEGRFTSHLLRSWEAHGSSLLGVRPQLDCDLFTLGGGGVHPMTRKNAGESGSVVQCAGSQSSGPGFQHVFHLGRYPRAT